MLDMHNIRVDKVVRTTAKGHAELVLTEHLESTTAPLTLILGSGDGTLHEIINALFPSPFKLVLIPCGTANALYSSFFPNHQENGDPTYKLKSLQAFIDKKPPVALSMAKTTLSPSQVIVSSVVVSTSLHASILHDSESLRHSHPGIERFKVAAQQNSTKWYNAHVTIFPNPDTGFVELYDSKSYVFTTHPESTTDHPVVNLEGPFAYFLSTVNVDRLEPKFRITPLRSIPQNTSTCDLVILRPLRDPSIIEDTFQARALFASKMWQILAAAYQDGGHIDLAYDQDGKIASQIEGPPVIEYIRCGGWEWIPDGHDQHAHLVCLDGAISRVPDQGSAFCTIDRSIQSFSIYA